MFSGPQNQKNQKYNWVFNVFWSSEPEKQEIPLGFECFWVHHIKTNQKYHWVLNVFWPRESETLINTIGSFMFPGQLGVRSGLGTTPCLDTNLPRPRRRTYTHDTDDTIARVVGRISQVLGLPPDFAESLQVIRYEPGQEYKPHFGPRRARARALRAPSAREVELTPPVFLRVCLPRRRLRPQHRARSARARARRPAQGESARARARGEAWR